MDVVSQIIDKIIEFFQNALKDSGMWDSVLEVAYKLFG